MRTRFAFRLAAALVAALALVQVPLAEQASAARSITPAAGLVCERYDNKLSVSPPRVWASYGTEQVTWTMVVQRWSGSYWYTYGTYHFYSSFNYYGQSVTSWGWWYANSTLNIPVSHRGHYRTYSKVSGNQGGVVQQAWVDGGRHCYVY